MGDDLVLTRAEVRRLDRRAIEEYGIPSAVLMENAGRACADEVIELVASLDAASGDESPAPVAVLCGPGNNGGDGFVIARTLVNRGVATRVFFLGSEAKLAGLTGDARANLELWSGLGGRVTCLASEQDVHGAAEELGRASLLVDALFGTGLDRPLRSPADELVRVVNASGRPVLAVDLPSGLDADTGAVLGEAVRARLTVTFVARKPGFGLGAGPECCGRVVVAEIGIPHTYLTSPGCPGDA